MALIKTDSQNYTDIADAIRGLIGVKIFFDEDITTENNSSFNVNMVVSDFDYFIDDYLNKLGQTFDVLYNNVSYICELKKYIVSADGVVYYLGNLSLIPLDGLSNTGEPFCIYKMVDNDVETNTIFYTTEAGTYHFTIKKEHYKPSEMKPALDSVIPDYGISYDTFDENGNVLSATTYGYKVAGLCGNKYLETVNIDSNATEVGDYAFYHCSDIVIKDNQLVYTGISNIELPNTITKIGDNAFSYCMNLTINTLPSNLSEIGNSAFVNINGSGELIIPKNVDKIGYIAFLAAGYTEYTFKGTPTTMGMGTFLCDVFDEDVEIINVPWSEGEVNGAPWGATNATINYNYVSTTEV